MPQTTNRVVLTHFLNGVGVSLDNLETIVEKRSRRYNLSLYRHPDLGKVLVLDGEIQHVEAWAALYHESLIHLAASFVPVVKSVAILGGGSLFAAFEALKYCSVERVIMLDHDPLVFETVAEFYPHARRCLRDARLEIRDRDAYSELSRTDNQFDLLVNDAADLLTIRTSKHRSSLFTKMVRSLRPKGVCADVIQRHVFERRHVRGTIQKLRRLRYALSLVFIPEYHGVLHLLAVWGKTSSFVSQEARKPINHEQLDWINGSGESPCVYYDPRFTAYYLYLPHYLGKVMKPRSIAA